MDLKNTAMKFFMTEEIDEQTTDYEGPRLVKSGHLNIMVRSPQSFTDVREYADSLMTGSAIMVSFESVDGALKNRIFDYLNGVSYICQATVSAINDDLLLYAPREVEVNKESSVKRGGMRSWLG